MKIKIIKLAFILSALTIGFGSCKKDSPAPSDPRDRFLGTYIGTVDYYDETETYIGSKETKLIIVKADINSEVTITASPVDNSISPVTYNGTINGNDINANTSVTANNKLTITEMVYTLNNNTIFYDGTAEITDITTQVTQTLYAEGIFNK